MTKKRTLDSVICVWDHIFGFYSNDIKDFEILTHVCKLWKLSKFSHLMHIYMQITNVRKIMSWTNIPNLFVDFSESYFPLLEEQPLLASHKFIKNLNVIGARKLDLSNSTCQKLHVSGCFNVRIPLTIQYLTIKNSTTDFFMSDMLYLTHLKLSHSHLTQENLSLLQFYPSLQVLALIKCYQLYDISELGSCLKLTALHFEADESFNGPIGLQYCTQITELKIVLKQVSITEITKLTQLTELTLIRWNNLESLNFLSVLTALQFVMFENPQSPIPKISLTN